MKFFGGNSMGLKKINLNRKQKIIAAIISVALLGGGTVGFLVINENIKQKQMMESMVEPYQIPGKEKIFMTGKIVPKESKEIYVKAEQGELNIIKVSNEQYVEKGEALFTAKNSAQISEIENLKSQIEMKKKEKEHLKNQSVEGQDNTQMLQSIDLEIKNLQSQVNKLNKTAYSTIVAPFNGKVYLNDNVQQGGPVLTLHSTEFYIKAQVNERDSYKIEQNQDVDIKILATEDKYQGMITYIGDNPLSGEELDQNSGSFSSMTNYRVNIELGDQKNLKNGLHIQAIAQYGIEDKKIPNTAILKEGSKSYIYKIQGDTAYKSEVTVSEVKEGFTMVKRGIVEGEIIIKDIQNRDIKDGQKINTGGY